MATDADDDLPETVVLRYLDGQLRPEERTSLSQWLRADPDHRRRFVEACLQAQLLEVIGGRSADSARPRSRLTTGRVAAFGLAAAIAATVVFVMRGSIQPPPHARGPATANLVAVLSGGEGGTTARLDGHPVSVGALLGPGRLTLDKGRVELDFLSGARVSLDGPAQLDLTSPWRATLVAGRAATLASEHARGFTLEGPGVAIVDLGTEFALDAASRKPRVRVFQGAVEASILGDDRSSLRTARLEAEGSTTFDLQTGAASKDDDGPTSWIRVAPRRPAPLDIGRPYADAVLEGKPLGYWRFDRTEQGLVPDEGGAGPSLRLVGPVEVVASGTNNRVIAFAPSPDGVEPERYAVTNAPLETLSAGDYSVELWLNAARFGMMDAVAFIPASRLESGKLLHFGLIELQALPVTFLHRPGAIRLLHRYPPGEQGATNAFSPAPYRPGRWHHVVGVRQGDTLSLYLDGNNVRTVAVAPDRGPGPMHVLLGRKSATNVGEQRSFAGWIDEVAIYGRALDAAEIKRHFTLAGGAP